MGVTLGRKKIIVASTYHAFKAWCLDHDVNPLNPRLICLSRREDVNRIRGLILTADDVAYAGDWRSRGDDLAYIEEWIRMCTR